MLTPQKALEETGIPSFFGAWKAEGDEKPPGQYIVYTMLTVPDEHTDNRVREYAVYAYVTLWTAANPRSAIALVRAEMEADGWAMADELIDYDDGDKMYRVAWTWKGWEDGFEG